MNTQNLTAVVDINKAAARLSVRFDSPEAAAEFATIFPKSYRVRASRLSALDNPNAGIVTAEAGLWETGVNGGVNEAGIARMTKILRKLREAGVPVQRATTNWVEHQRVTDAEAHDLIGL